jgi:hypothetical protein
MTEKRILPNSSASRGGNTYSSGPTLTTVFSVRLGRGDRQLHRLGLPDQRKPMGTKEVLDIVQAALDLIADDTAF